MMALLLTLLQLNSDLIDGEKLDFDTRPKADKTNLYSFSNVSLDRLAGETIDLSVRFLKVFQTLRRNPDSSDLLCSLTVKRLSLT